MKSFFIQPALDAAGFWASALCAVHCVAVPLLMSFSAFSALTILEDKSIEYTVLGVSSILGVVSLLPSCIKYHRKLKALIFLLVGFAQILSGQVINNSFCEILLTSFGALTIALAHVVNFKLCQHYHKGI